VVRRGLLLLQCVCVVCCNATDYQFETCILGVQGQDVMLEEYPGVDDTWLDVIGTQGSSLLALDISGSAVTDAGLKALEMCNNLQTLILSSCDHISDAGLVSLTGKSLCPSTQIPHFKT
jgi:hypothetical protein